MKYKMLIFDLDNTIFDYDRAENYALEKTLKYYKYPYGEAVKKSYREINEQTWQRFERGEITSGQLRVMRFEAFGSEWGFTWEAAEVSRLYLENLGLGGFLIDGAEELLGKLKGDFRLSALTNGISDVQRSRLANSPLSGYFDPLVISDEVGVAKPDPAIFEILLDKAAIADRKDVLMIGDSLSSDISGARSAGIECCWYNPEGAGVPEGVIVDHQIRELSEFIEIAYREE